MDCMDFVYRTRGRSIPTVNSVRAKLVALWSFLARKAIVPTYPDVPKWIEPECVPIAWLPHELSRLFAACQSQQGWVCSIPAGEWWTGLHSFLYDTGERLGATLALEWRDVDLGGRWVRVRAETRKGKRKGMTFRLHEDTAAIISDWPQYGNRKVFAWHKSRETLWLHYERILAAAKLPVDRWHKFHAMRKTHASFAEAAGLDASRLLGHSDRRVTEASYLDLRICGKAPACDVLFRPLDDGPDKPAA
jgi:integrase